MVSLEKVCTWFPTHPVVRVHQIHTAGGASGSATMVMVFSRSFVLFLSCDFSVRVFVCEKSMATLP